MIFIIIILGIFLFDFAKLREQNKKMIQQNDQMITLLEEMIKGRNESFLGK